MAIKSGGKRKRVEKKVKKPIEMPSSPVNDDGTPLRSIFCLKRKTDLQRIEAIDDCFVLEFNPFDSTDTSKIPVTSNAEDLYVIAEKGKLACRDYPHSRHLCLKYPFAKTPHKKYCELCYCYVCDSAAPCKNWSGSNGTHCHALDNEAWKEQRRLMRKKSAS